MTWGYAWNCHSMSDKMDRSHEMILALYCIYNMYVLTYMTVYCNCLNETFVNLHLQNSSILQYLNTRNVLPIYGPGGQVSQVTWNV